MDLSLIANIKNIPAVHNFLDSQEQDEWLNKNSPLFEAQKVHNRLMANNTTRIPMVVEYLASAGNRISVPLYINPSRLNMSTQKIKSKAVTRGGIFYHHWGDDHWQMQLSGTTGDAGMEGIKKLEDIYNMSGVLLAYGESSSAPRYVDGTTSFLNSIASGNFAGAISALLQGGVGNIGQSLRNQATGAIVGAITGRGSASTRSSAVFNKLNTTLGEGVKKINGFLGGNTSISGNQSFIGQVGGALLGNLIGQRIGLIGEGDTQVVDFSTAAQGWADMDELEDPWRPRQVWIYFEDRVFIGHFDSFTYQRVAETPLINYDMRFTVIRQVIVTSYNPKKPEFKPAQAITLPTVFNAMQAAAAYSGSTVSKPWQTKIVEFARKTPKAIEDAKLEIIKVKETLKRETLIAEFNGGTITAQRKTALEDWMAQIRKTVGIKDDDEIYGVRPITDQQRLDYYKLANPDKTVNPKGINDDAAAAVDAELARIKAATTTLLAKGTAVAREQALAYWPWILSIHEATGTRAKEKFAKWELDLKPVDVEL